MPGARKPLLHMVLDAAVMAGLAFFSAIPAAALADAPDPLRLMLLVGGFAAGGAFFFQLALDRGLKRG